MDVAGVDISRKALNLAIDNRQEQAQRYPQTLIKDVKFIRGNIFDSSTASGRPALLDYLKGTDAKPWDIIISNPPYISPNQFSDTTARSVRNFEPKLALVPEPETDNLSDDEHGDLFYPRLLHIAHELDTKVLLMEVGDLSQAKRVATLAKSAGWWDGIEIWCDEPDAADEYDNVLGDMPVRGTGNGRSVICWRGSGGSWLGR
jgi:methylase of polypeptide subunit release factors